MVTLFGTNGVPHLIYKDEDTEAVIKLTKQMQNTASLMKMLMNPATAMEYERIFMHDEAEIIGLLDGITIMTAQGPRKMYIMLAEEQ